MADTAETIYEPVTHPANIDEGSSFDDGPDEAYEAPVVAADLISTCTLQIKGKDVSVEYDLSEMTPRMKRKIVKLADTANEDEQTDTLVEYLTVVVLSWTMTDRKGELVPVEKDAIEGLSYKTISAVVSAINKAVASPNASAGTE